ncbi:MAG: GAF domain-containing sensor histidine kinase, partial [Chroococcales cyanobacterium]
MSYSNYHLVPASSEYIALCQSQVALLTQGLGASASAVYFTSELVESDQVKLVPVVVYPNAEAVWDTNERLKAVAPEGLTSRLATPRLLSARLPQAREQQAEASQGEWEENVDWRRRQLVLPLIHEEMVLGLLVTGREDRPWNEPELGQINRIAQTLAIAGCLDQRQGWYQQQLRQQQVFQEQQKDRFDDLLHQIRNPLTALRTFGKLLLKRLLPEDGNRNIAQSIIRESDRLQQLLQQFDDYIDLMETEQLTLTLDASPVSVSSEKSLPSLLPGSSLNLEDIYLIDVLDPLLISAEAIAQERNLILSGDIPPGLPPVKGDPRALAEVFNNLIDNALKYTPAGGKISVQIVERQTEKKAWQGVMISDNGVGIPPEDQARIFERHFRGVQASGNISGSGLGLAIAKEMVEQMDGEIELISSTQPNNRGTT